MIIVLLTHIKLILADYGNHCQNKERVGKCPMDLRNVANCGNRWASTICEQKPSHCSDQKKKGISCAKFRRILAKMVGCVLGGRMACLGETTTIHRLKKCFNHIQFNIYPPFYNESYQYYLYPSVFGTICKNTIMQPQDKV